MPVYDTIANIFTLAADLHPCEQWGVCSQECEPVTQTWAEHQYRCKCYDHYVLKDRHTCVYNGESRGYDIAAVIEKSKQFVQLKVKKVQMQDASTTMSDAHTTFCN